MPTAKSKVGVKGEIRWMGQGEISRAYYVLMRAAANIPTEDPDREVIIALANNCFNIGHLYKAEPDHPGGN